MYMIYIHVYITLTYGNIMCVFLLNAYCSKTMKKGDKKHITHTFIYYSCVYTYIYTNIHIANNIKSNIQNL